MFLTCRIKRRKVLVVLQKVERIANGKTCEEDANNNLKYDENLLNFTTLKPELITTCL